MKNPPNPFPVTAYYGPKWFCDREEESSQLVSFAKNGMNTTLFSIRRMGKTGLLHHTLSQLDKLKYRGIYVDIYATLNLKEFTAQLVNSSLKAFPEEKGIGRKLMELVKSFRPTLSFDPLTGIPEVGFEMASAQQTEQSLAGIINFLENQSAPILVAIDEFQQIASYPEHNTEALLRSLIQPLKNVRFVFSGSSKHLLTEIFSNNQRPFYASSQFIHLTAIPPEKYLPFIKHHFDAAGKSITEESLQFIADFTRLHTYYTQSLCNRIFATDAKNFGISIVKETCDSLISEQEAVYYQYRNLLTSTQWKLLAAIASEGEVEQALGQKFIKAYQLGSSASIQRSLEALLSKEMIYKTDDTQKSAYRVYDVFLERWLARTSRKPTQFS